MISDDGEGERDDQRRNDDHERECRTRTAFTLAPCARPARFFALPALATSHRRGCRDFTQPVGLTDSRTLVVFCSDQQVAHRLKQGESEVIAQIAKLTRDRHLAVAIDAVVVEPAVLLLAQTTFRFELERE